MFFIHFKNKIKFVAFNSRCTSIAWVPGGDGSFVAAHADGNLYVYEKNKEGATDSSFSAIRDPTQFSVDKAKYSKVPEVFGSVFNFHSMLFSRTVCVALAR
jgi:hypothetical protein